METTSIFCHNDLKNIVQVLKYAQSFVFLKSMRSYMYIFQVRRLIKYWSRSVFETKWKCETFQYQVNL